MVNPSSPIRPERDARSARLASRVPSTRIASSLLVCLLARTFVTVCCRTFASAARDFSFVPRFSTVDMAVALRYALRPVVVGQPGGHHDQRGEDNLLRVRVDAAPSGLALALRDTDAFQVDPVDASLRCLPHWLVEGLLSRVARFGATARDKVFATSALSVACLSRIEDALVALGFDFSAALTVGAVVHRLHSFPDPGGQGHAAAFDVAAAGDFFALGALPAPDAANDNVQTQVLQTLTFGDLLVNSGCRLRVFADLCLLVQGRYSHIIRTAPNGHFHRTFSRLLPFAERALAVEGVPADPDPVRVMDMPVKIREYLSTTSLPWQLIVIHVGDRGMVTTDFAAREAVRADAVVPIIARRWDTFVCHFPTLAKIVKDVDAGDALNNIQVLASNFSVQLTNVSSFCALEASITQYAFVLAENTGAGVVAGLRVEERVAAFTRAFSSASSRLGREASSADANVSSVSSISGPSGTTAGPFARGNADALRVWRNDPKYSAYCENMRTSLASEEAPRVLRRAAQQRDFVIFSFMMSHKDPYTDIPLLKSLAPFKMHLSKYISGYMVTPKTSAISLVGHTDGGDSADHAAGLGVDKAVSAARKKWEISKDCLKALREGRIDEIDWFEELVVSIAVADANGDRDRAHFNQLEWPDEVCGDKAAVELIRNRGNDLFVAIGFEDQDDLGFYGLWNEIFSLLDGSPPGTMPGKLIARDLVIPQLDLVSRRIKMALTFDASAAFPTFARPADAFFKDVKNMYHNRDTIALMQAAGLVMSSPAAQKRARDGAPLPPPAGQPDQTGKGKGKGKNAKGKGKGGGAGDGGKNGARGDGKGAAATDTTVTVGKRAGKVTVAGNTMTIIVNAKGTKLKWNLATYDSVLDSLGENKNDFCKSCNALRVPNRLEFCQNANLANHQTATSSAHVTKNPIETVVAALDAALI